MIKLIILFLLLGFGLFAGTQYSGEQGYVLISIANTTTEMSFTTFTLLIVFTLLVIFAIDFLIKRTWRFGFNTFNWFSLRKVRHSRRLANEGIVHLLEGDWKKAEKKVTRWAKHHDVPFLCYLIAAEAAQSRGDIEQRDYYLTLANDQNGSALAIELTKAKQWVKNKEYQQAILLLKQLQTDYPDNAIVLTQLKESYNATQDWQSLHLLLPKLKKFQLISEPEYQELMVKCQTLPMHTLTAQEDYQGLANFWVELPRKAKQDLQVNKVYIESLIELGKHEDALRQLRPICKSSSLGWPFEKLAQLHERLDDQVFAILRQTLNKMPTHAEAASALGHRLMAKQDWVNAQQALEQALQQRSSIQDYASLAHCLEQQDMPKAAHDVTQRALLIAQDSA